MPPQRMHASPSSSAGPMAEFDSASTVRSPSAETAVSQLEELDDEAAAEIVEAAVEASWLRTGGYLLAPLALVAITVAVLGFGLPPPPDVVGIGILLTLIGSLVAVPLIARRHLRRALRERDIDPQLAGAVISRLRGRRLSTSRSAKKELAIALRGGWVAPPHQLHAPSSVAVGRTIEHEP